MPQEQMLNSGEVETHIWRAQRKKSCARVNSRRIKSTSSVKLAIHMMPRSSTCERPRQSSDCRKACASLGEKPNLLSSRATWSCSRQGTRRSKRRPCLSISRNSCVHAVNQRNERNNIFHLVLLQMTYEVPLDVFRHKLLFVKEFLYPTLSENALSRIVGFAQGFDGMKLRNCHERCPCRERPV